MAALTKKARKAIDARITAAYNAVGNGIVIDIMDIPKIFNFARPIVIIGVTDEDLKGIIAGYLDTIRKN
jgi:hypothetical protein